MCSKDFEFSFCAQVSYDVFCHIRLVTWTLSTFQGVDKWYFRIWMGKSCRCAIFFHPWSHKSVEKWCFFQILVSWTPSTFQGIVNNFYARMLSSSPCRYPIRFQKLYFVPRAKKLHFYYLAKSYYSILLLSPLGGRCDPSFQKNLIPVYPWKLSAKFGLIWQSGSWVEVFIDF